MAGEHRLFDWRYEAAGPSWLLIGLGVASVCFSGCSDIERFDNTDGSAYCGNVVGASFVRQGFEHRPRLQLELDVSALNEFPGVITTDDERDGPCQPEATFDHAPMRISQKLQADPLSALQFGETREFNFMAWADSTCDGTHLAVVSLMRSGRVEVRLMRSEASKDGTEQGPFGVFLLERYEDQCGF